MSGANWADLRARSLSALVMLAVGAVAIWLGGSVYLLLILAAVAAMQWELWRMTLGQGRDTPLWAGYGLAILLAGAALIWLRGLPNGFLLICWLLAVVIASDVMGYFAGRALGGPKFWPRISPKKTWSGTVAGWIGAALVGVVFAALDRGTGPGLVLLSPFVAFAGQMGDIAESAIKRRAGVKDSSNLIPGHGGVLDRFDALIFAAIVVGAAALFLFGAGH
ncbi:phosphatidate cytidylyltransferase [Gemmobacter caeni]|uniref:Phosphatidate cytidylyltransferase n=1 Tax=Gemmobacter caeni TaxID=589035 RepID=A0A2T6AXP2_9RHOB|nr:phosphatidate cytidylyltransferase [Gemmobacter caeni]PTX48585.1 phosphatidate cytidylyltransferase [Gemmobacter caeni]TWI99614.1 phosphatidate cytidylyltransferase [Gemmobacter caeni]